jgi:peroxiredoxin Q/BCP
VSAVVKKGAAKTASARKAPARPPLPKVGSVAPDFTLAADDGSEVQLKALRGQPVVLYFYPKDNTPGCTTEACEFRDLFPRFRKGKAVVLGVSPDSVRKHQNFRKKFELPFTLLADTDHAVAERYGVWGEKTFWGRKYMGVLRTTFLIDAEGRIARVWEDVSVEGHADEVARALQSS